MGELRPGQFFGEVGLLDRGPSVTTVTAATEISVLVFSVVEFRAVLDPGGLSPELRRYGLAIVAAATGSNR
jgi:CRP-like cAMP-binding protein